MVVMYVFRLYIFILIFGGYFRIKKKKKLYVMGKNMKYINFLFIGKNVIWLKRGYLMIYFRCLVVKVYE